MFMYIIAMLVLFAATCPVLAADASPSNAAGAAAGLVASMGPRPQRKAPPAGSSEHRIDSGGVARRYLMYLPESLDREVPAPVVVDFHGSGSDPREEMQVTGMTEAAERYGFLLLMPFAAVEMAEGGYTWNVPPEEGLPNDVQFMIDVLDRAAQQVFIDERRVYVTGFSGGARLASEIACSIPERIAGLGAVGGLRSPSGCAGRVVPVVAFHGTADPINPYDGGGPDYWTYGIEAAARGWVERNGCATKPAASRISQTVVALRYDGCLHGSDVVLYRVESGGHTWPGSSYPFPAERFGRLDRELDATALMLQFFAFRPAGKSLNTWSTQ